MRGTLHLRVAVVLLVLMACTSAQMPQGAPTPVPVGSATVADWKGNVTLRSPQGAVLKPQKGLSLPPDTTIETADGSILLALQDGSQVLVKTRSRVVLNSPPQTSGRFLQLLLGNIIAKVEKRIGLAPSFKLGTPSAVISVRGTQFEVQVTRKKKTIVMVYEGLVEVAPISAGAGAPVLLEPGFGTEVEEGQKPGPPQRLTNKVNNRPAGQGGGLTRHTDQRNGTSPYSPSDPFAPSSDSEEPE